MQDSLTTGLMAAFAVSGGVAFLAMHAHNRLLSDFINKISTGALKDVPRKKKVIKKVRFDEDVAAESTVEKGGVKKRRPRPAAADCRSNIESLEAMPQNRQVLYKGILQQKNIHSHRGV